MVINGHGSFYEDGKVVVSFGIFADCLRINGSVGLLYAETGSDCGDAG